MGFLIGFLAIYLVTAEYARPPRNKGEILVFRRGKVPRESAAQKSDVESLEVQRPVVAARTEIHGTINKSEQSRPIFHWEDLCYDIKIKGETRRILDHIDGWVQPGTSTALMVTIPL